MWGIVMWTTGRSVDYLDQEACINHIDPGFGMFFEEERASRIVIPLVCLTQGRRT